MPARDKNTGFLGGAFMSRIDQTLEGASAMTGTTQHKILMPAKNEIRQFTWTVADAAEMELVDEPDLPANSASVDALQ